MRNHLNGCAEIFTAPFSFYDCLIDAARCDVAGLRQAFIDKALIMTKVQIGFRTVIGHKDLTMLIGVHGAGIDVDIRIEFLVEHPKPAAFQQSSQRRCSNAFAE